MDFGRKNTGCCTDTAYKLACREFAPVARECDAKILEIYEGASVAEKLTIAGRLL